jgi:hypothetical protein
MIPGIIVMIGMLDPFVVYSDQMELMSQQVIACMTSWCGYMVGRFKILHPSVYNIDDAGFLMFGRIGREIMYWGFNICKMRT